MVYYTSVPYIIRDVKLLTQQYYLVYSYPLHATPVQLCLWLTVVEYYVFVNTIICRVMIYCPMTIIINYKCFNSLELSMSKEQSLGINNFKYLLENDHFNLIAMGELNKMF